MSRRSDKGPVPIGEIIGASLDRLGIDRELDDYRIWQAWDEVVGEAIRRNAEPVRLDGQRLVVAARNASWMQELTLMRGEIVERLNRWMGREVITEIFIVASGGR
ncbi:MAG: DUF721 domain-containing protein [Deltaproteobacteria bacterium]